MTLILNDEESTAEYTLAVMRLICVFVVFAFAVGIPVSAVLDVGGPDRITSDDAPPRYIATVGPDGGWQVLADCPNERWRVDFVANRTVAKAVISDLQPASDVCLSPVEV